MTQSVETLLKEARHHQATPQAIAIYKSILTQDSHQLDALREIALCYAQMNQMEEAIDYFKQAIKVDSSDYTLFNNLGNAYKRIQAYEQASEAYENALKLNPNYAQAHNNIAGIYALRNQYREALNHYRSAVHAQPDFIFAHYNLGLLLLKHNQLDAAAKQFNNVISLQANHLNAYFYLGVLHLEANRINEAEKAFKSVLLIDHEHVNSLINLGVIALKRDEAQIAIDFFTRALAYDENNIDARNNLAATFIHHDRYENALTHYHHLLKQNPIHPEYLYNAGVAEMALGHLNEARIHFETLLRNQNDHFAALNNLAAIHSRLGDRQTAIALLKKANRINPADTSTQFMLNALTGENTQPQASAEYVTNLFNAYALYYDQHMQATLQYTLPFQIARLIHQLIPDQKVEHALDLGCGTGLTGNVLRENCLDLTGVDLSPKMLDAARKKNIYDKLIESDVIDFLQHDKQHYFLIVAADLLPYFGELETLFDLIKNRLSSNGIFIFTTEMNAHLPWQLQNTARFSHQIQYIHDLCKKYQFNLIHEEESTARTQDQQPLKVMIYVIKKS